MDLVHIIAVASFLVMLYKYLEERKLRIGQQKATLFVKDHSISSVVTNAKIGDYFLTINLTLNNTGKFPLENLKFFYFLAGDHINDPNPQGVESSFLNEYSLGKPIFENYPETIKFKIKNVPWFSYDLTAIILASWTYKINLSKKKTSIENGGDTFVFRIDNALNLKPQLKNDEVRFISGQAIMKQLDSDDASGVIRGFFNVTTHMIRKSGKSI